MFPLIMHELCVEERGGVFAACKRILEGKRKEIPFTISFCCNLCWPVYVCTLQVNRSDSSPMMTKMKTKIDYVDDLYNVVDVVCINLPPLVCMICI